MIEDFKKMSGNIGSLCIFLQNKKNIDYLNYLNDNIPVEILDFKISEKVYYYLNDIKEIRLCSCGKPLSFIGFKNGHRSTCGKKECHIKKRKETCIEKFGVDNPKKSKDIIDKEKNNIKKKWGDHFMKNEIVKDKFKKSMLEKWGVEWGQQSDEIRSKTVHAWAKKDKLEINNKRRESFSGKSSLEKEKIYKKRIKTIENKWGTYQNFIDYRLSCIKNSSIEKWGVDHHFKSDVIKNKRIDSYRNGIINKIKNSLPDNLSFILKEDNKNSTDSIIRLLCEKCNSEFDINRQLLISRRLKNYEVCLNCNPILSGKSNREIEIYDFIKDNYDGQIFTNLKNIISKELDIYIPDLKLAFEFNGLFWHSELFKSKLYHLEKTKECLDKGIELIHIWEDDWDLKKDIVKSIIMNKLGKTPNKIWARKCEIIELEDNKLVKEFLEKNHIQGFIGSKIKLGLFFEGDLISLMTFGKIRRSLGNKRSKNDTYEMLRFCNKLNTNVVGGASRLFKYLNTNYNFDEVISYSDSSRSQGNLYKKIGFSLLSETVPNYYWVVDGVKKHRFNFRKDKLIKEGANPNKTEVEIMLEREYYRIFDCGSRKWIFKNNSSNR